MPKKKKKKLLNWLLFGGGGGCLLPLLLILVVMIYAVSGLAGAAGGGAALSQNGGNGDGQAGTQGVSDKVLAYQSDIKRYAEQYGMDNYIALIMAVMMQESGGEGLDPMQASEGGYNTRYPNVPGGITDPQYSIQCGVQELKSVLQLAGATGPTDMEHIKLALQCYNYGVGFYYGVSRYDWPGTKVWTQALADEYHQKSHSGDPQYINHVLRYYTAAGDGFAGEYAWPVPGHTRISSPFGQRAGEYHKGIDIADGNVNGAPIVAAADGKVTRAMTGFGVGHIGSTDGGGYGNHCYISCANGVEMRYGHASRIVVSTGDIIKRGQIIGYVGTSGSSTGPHLHFEIRVGGTPVDPMTYYKPAASSGKTSSKIGGN